MRIHTPEVFRTGETIRLSARVETDRRTDHVPPELWFEFAAEFEPMVDPGIESFVVALYPFAMHLGEDICIEETLSPRLAYHIRTADQVLSRLEPELFSPIEIRHGGFHPEPPPRAPGVGVTFSGGVDAYYSLLRHLPQHQPVPEYAVTHGLFVHGFDLPPSGLASYREALSVYRAQFERLGLTLVPAAFNVFDFLPAGSDEVRWFWMLRTHTIGMAGLGLALSSGLGRIVMGSSQPFDVYEYGIGGDYEIASSLSTEWFEVLHDSVVEDRVEKTIAVAGWPETYDALRVCVWDPQGVRNCGRCPKCVRTMATLEAIGRLEAYSSFPKPFRPSIIPKVMTGIRGSHYLPGMIRLARDNGRGDLVRMLTLALLIARFRAAMKGIFNVIAPDFKNPVAEPKRHARKTA